MPEGQAFSWVTKKQRKETRDGHALGGSQAFSKVASGVPKSRVPWPAAGQ